jgi:REP element-mobilizing transposase RayT
VNSPEYLEQNRDREGAAQSTYLITFVCYGAWLPGQAGAVDRRHNLFGAPLPVPDVMKELQAGWHMCQPRYLLDDKHRQIVMQAMREVCSHRGWTLLAAHVRTNHVHAVVEANRSAEHVMNVLKSYSSRALNQMGLDETDRRRWARHGSTRHLWTADAVSAAVHYVVCEQGEAMAVFEMSRVE